MRGAGIESRFSGYAFAFPFSLHGLLFLNGKKGMDSNEWSLIGALTLHVHKKHLQSDVM
jgi:hypothetical protein